jgi:hypothetical protein
MFSLLLEVFQKQIESSRFLKQQSFPKTPPVTTKGNWQKQTQGKKGQK